MDQVKDAPPSGTVESDYVSTYMFFTFILIFMLLLCEYIYVYYAIGGFVGGNCRLEVQGDGRFQGQAIPI